MHAASLGHRGNSCHGFHSAEEDSACFIVWKAGYIQAVVISVDEIDVGIARRAEKNLVAWSPSRGGMRGWVVLAEVGFGLDDASCEDLAA
jgi:hypothetical protein